MSISIKNLTKKYGEQTVLNNISLEIGAGEVVGFLGPNGAGKTTTMRIICGSLSYEIGSVQVCGLEVTDNALKTKALIGYLPEQNPLYSDMYVAEYLTFIAESYGIKNSKNLVEQLIDKVGLRPEFQKKIGQLSKGYRQRVGLAQALIPNPKVLILDEPTTGLDPNQLDEIRTLIREIGADKTVLLSTHIMQEIKAICNRIIIINKGEIVADYPNIDKITLTDKTNLQFEIEFLHKTDKQVLMEITEIQSVNEKSENYFEIIASDDIRSKIFDFAVETNNKILTIKQIERTMEEVFRSLTH
ncbi:MAG: ATP-binding cassette domain-containing protein [Paludibacter sp.]|jgi:ABC-2 type transport system ATP-binding protein|nr:ATP-binding cassette domain-containing protein [Paludibacter sp.]